MIPHFEQIIKRGYTCVNLVNGQIITQNPTISSIGTLSVMFINTEESQDWVTVFDTIDLSFLKSPHFRYTKRFLYGLNEYRKPPRFFRNFSFNSNANL